MTRRGLLVAGAAAAGLSGCGGSTEPGPGRPASRRTPVAPEPTPAPVTAPARVELLARGSWDARPAGPGTRRHTVERLTVHHSALRLDRNADAPAQLRSLQAEHLRNQWSDIAYHWLLDREGNVYAGRDPATVGDTFTPYDPTGHFLVCLLGQYDEQPVTAPQLAALAQVLAWATVGFGVGTDTIAGHGDHEPTTPCPGRRVVALLEDGSLVRRVEAHLAEGMPVLREVRGAEAARRVRAVETA